METYHLTYTSFIVQKLVTLLLPVLNFFYSDLIYYFITQTNIYCEHYDIWSNYCPLSASTYAAGISFLFQLLHSSYATGHSLHSPLLSSFLSCNALHQTELDPCDNLTTISICMSFTGIFLTGLEVTNLLYLIT